MPNFYAALFANGSHKLFDNWASCEKAVKGVSGVRFKKFPSQGEAKQWVQQSSIHPISDLLSSSTTTASPTDNRTLHIYVDGSFKPSSVYAGWGWAATQNNQVIATGKGKTGNPAESRNIDGEVEAALQALSYANSKEIPCIIYHDYQGISSWANGEWKTKSNIARTYIERLKQITVPYRFTKVKGHSGNEWNDLADKLANEGLEG